MPIRFSKILLLIEALFLIVPISLLFTTLLPAAFSFLFKFKSLSSSASSLLVFVMGAALLSSARVLAAFYCEGASGLRRVHGVWWCLCAAGASISVAGVVTSILKRSVGVSDSDFVFVLKLASMGILLIIPLAHVLLELLFRSKSAHAA
jgi:hypothetical protein